MKKTEMSNVPEYVWRGVWNKWKSALRTGWYDDLWSRCDLCKFMGREADCRGCPIYDESWCRGIQTASKINIKYHIRKVIRSKLPRYTPACAIWLIGFVHNILHDDIIFRDEVIDSWYEGVEEFIKYIEPYCGPGISVND